eukprot:8108777-Pyramimonas_sp.AAC.1
MANLGSTNLFGPCTPCYEHVPLSRARRVIYPLKRVIYPGEACYLPTEACDLPRRGGRAGGHTGAPRGDPAGGPPAPPPHLRHRPEPAAARQPAHGRGPRPLRGLPHARPGAQAAAPPGGGAQ